jgi:hypothetical protein
MVTFISSTFEKASVQQQNALASWRIAGVPYILAGVTDDKGAQCTLSSVATEAALGYPGNAPLLRSMILQALPFVETPMVAIINADIIIEPNFLQKLDRIIEKYGDDIFLTSVRRDTEWSAPIEDWDEFFRTPWKPHQDASADLFIADTASFRNFAIDTGDFIYGRLAWDNWIHLYFQARGKTRQGGPIPCFNSSEVLVAWHQKHGYEHVNAESFDQVKKDPAANHNCHLFGQSVIKAGRSLKDIIRVKQSFPEAVI